MNIHVKQISILFLALVASLFLLDAHAGKPVKVTVETANPSSAYQGDTPEVEIEGAGFDAGSTVRFIVTDSRDDTQIEVVSPVTFVSPGKLKVKIKVKDAALPVEYDIEVRTSSGRRGKGTTLFRVREKAGNEPVTPDKKGAEYILFDGDLASVDEEPVEGCCLNRGPHPAYTMHLSDAFGDLEGDHDGQLYISGGGGMVGYMVEFWVEGEFGFGFYFIGGVIERDRKNKHLTVTFTDEPWNWHDPNNELPKATATFVLDRFPAD